MDVIQNCLQCHNGRGGINDGPSVLSGINGALLRQAGFLTVPGELNHTGHTLGSLHRALGGTWTPGSQGLTCTDCHDAHGENGQYRNLVLRPGTATEDRRVTLRRWAEQRSPKRTYGSSLASTAPESTTPGTFTSISHSSAALRMGNGVRAVTPRPHGECLGVLACPG